MSTWEGQNWASISSSFFEPGNLNQILIDQDNSTESIEVDCDLSATMPPEQRLYYENLTHGLVTKLNTEIDSFAKEGYYVRTIEEQQRYINDTEYPIEFEPDDDLINKVSDTKNGTKILSFSDKKLH